MSDVAEGPQTDLVRLLWPMHPDVQHGSAVDCIHRLCDEIDRLRAALLIAAEQCVSTTDPDEVPWLIDRWMARAALAESGDTERPATMDTGLVEVRQVRCPTCGSDDPYRQGIVGEKWEPLTNEGGQWWQVLCNDHLHAVGWCHCEPQVAPEPERPDAYPGWVLLAKRQTDRDQFILLCMVAAQGGTADDYGAAWDEAHRPAPLVEGEQG